MRKLIVLVLLVAILLLTAVPAFAQEITAEPVTVEPTLGVEETPSPEPTATPEPTPTPVPPAPTVDTVGLFSSLFQTVALAIAFFGVAGFSLAGLVLFLQRKDVQDNLERAYQSMSPEQQRQFREAYEQLEALRKTITETSGKVSEILDRVSDGLPNTDVVAQANRAAGDYSGKPSE